jgi:hypothetical protein
MNCFLKKKTYPIFPPCDPADILKMKSIKDKYLQVNYLLKTDETYQKLFYERLRTLNRLSQSNTYYLNHCEMHISDNRKQFMDNNIKIILEVFDDENLSIKYYYENPYFIQEFNPSSKRRATNNKSVI